MVFCKRVFISLIFFGVLLTTGGAWSADDFVIRSDDRNFSSNVSAKGAATKGGEAESGRRWVVAVGICKFTDTRITELTYCVPDALSIVNYFKADGVSAERIILLADEDAKKSAIVNSLKEIAKNIAPDDSLFFFYSSHGLGDKSGTTYFVTFDTVMDDLAATALPMQELKNAVKEIKCYNIVMMIDSCHSGGVKSMGMQDEKAFDKLVRTADRGTRVAILTSSRTHETSIESEEIKHGVFTYFMLKGLAGASDNFPRDGHVSVTELFDYVMVAVPRATDRAQHPSGKFSYNWPGKKEQAVRVGQTSGGASNTPGSGSQGEGRSGASGGSWQNVIEGR